MRISQAENWFDFILQICSWNYRTSRTFQLFSYAFFASIIITFWGSKSISYFISNDLDQFCQYSCTIGVMFFPFAYEINFHAAGVFALIGSVTALMAMGSQLLEMRGDEDNETLTYRILTFSFFAALIVLTWALPFLSVAILGFSGTDITIIDIILAVFQMAFFVLSLALVVLLPLFFPIVLACLLISPYTVPRALAFVTTKHKLLKVIDHVKRRGRLEPIDGRDVINALGQQSKSPEQAEKLRQDTFRMLKQAETDVGDLQEERDLLRHNRSVDTERMILEKELSAKLLEIEKMKEQIKALDESKR